MAVCDDCAGRLTAFLHRELPLSDAEKIERHLTECAECRAKLESLHGVTRNLRKQVLTEPSARVRKQLQQRMEQALHPPPKKPDSARQAPPAQDGWRISTSEPQALTFTPAPALPAPAALPAPQGLPPIALEGPATRAVQNEASARISARLTARSARLSQNRERLGVLVCVGLALVTALLGVFAWRQLHTPTPAAQSVQAREAAAKQQRWQDRIRLRDQDQIRQSFLSRELKLPLEVSSTQLYLLPHHDALSGETFLALYREEDIDALLKNPTVDAAALRALIDSASKLPVTDGQVELPAKLPNGSGLDEYLGREFRVSTLGFGYRTEIWATPRLQRYLSSPSAASKETSGLPVSHALPPERL